MNKKGFSLIELMVVIAIIAILSMLTIPQFMKFLAKTKRTEAYVQLRSLYMEEKAYFAENGKYTSKIIGNGSLGWKPEGVLQYSYGFSGAQGQHHVVGALQAPGSALSGSRIGDNQFLICAAGDIDGDGELDIIAIDQDGVIKIVQDDLAN